MILIRLFGKWPAFLSVAVATILLVNPPVLFGQSVEQVVPLQAGWNAVFLYVEPEVAEPDVVFGDLPVEQVNVWMPERARVASLTDPEALPSKPSEWNVWHPQGHPAAFLNTLYRVPARRGLLIKASAATTLVVRGEPVYRATVWQAPGFVLTGFDVDAEQAPSFARWFAGSRAHAALNIQKLVNGHWQKVHPQEVIQRGVAYWVWSSEGSDFQGPVGLQLPIEAAGYLRLLTGSVGVSGSVVNRGVLPASLSLANSGGRELSLALQSGAGEVAPASFPLAQGERVRLRVAAEAGVEDATSVLRLKGSGTDIQISVRP